MAADLKALCEQVDAIVRDGVKDGFIVTSDIEPLISEMDALSAPDRGVIVVYMLAHTIRLHQMLSDRVLDKLSQPGGISLGKGLSARLATAEDMELLKRTVADNATSPRPIVVTE